MRIEIRGHNLPGRTWCSDGADLDNVHVAVQENKNPVGLVRGDTRKANWDVDVRVVTTDDRAPRLPRPVPQARRPVPLPHVGRRRRPNRSFAISAPS